MCSVGETAELGDRETSATESNPVEAEWTRGEDLDDPKLDSAK